MLELNLPAHAGYEDMITRADASGLQISVIRDATLEGPILRDEVVFVRGRGEIYRELDRLSNIETGEPGSGPEDLREETTLLDRN
ncbi:hypothetical protein [Salinispira pacifica]|uniref:Uncharacterized protein n=1 Tax=Salinispira pacifica TaxID=1307761 RepID=V5WL10_9SPIO|nr:hypothetical protein [Salinispira pacifica]AHC16438.1 hypothetical protein L21SP2_3096 [Salinispira pacifica]